MTTFANLCRLAMAVLALLAATAVRANDEDDLRRIGTIGCKGWRLTNKGMPMCYGNIFELFPPDENPPHRLAVWIDPDRDIEKHLAIAHVRWTLRRCLPARADSNLEKIDDDLRMVVYGLPEPAEEHYAKRLGNADLATRLAIADVDSVLRMSRTGEGAEARLRIELLRAPSGEVILERELSAAPAQLATTVPQLVRDAYGALSIPLPKGQEKTFADGMFGAPESFATFATELQRLHDTHGAADTPELAKAYRTWFEADRRNEAAWFRWAGAAYTSGAASAAEILAELTAPGTPANATFAAWVGYAFMEKKDLANAEKAFRHGFTLPGNKAECYAGYSELLVQQRKFEEAATYAAKATDSLHRARAKALYLGVAIYHMREAVRNNRWYWHMEGPDREIIDYIDHASLGALAEAFERAPDRLDIPYYFFRLLMLMSYVPIKGATYLADVVLAESKDADLKRRMVASVAHFSQPQYQREEHIDLAHKYVMANLGLFSDEQLHLNFTGSWYWFVSRDHGGENLPASASASLAESELKRDLFATAASRAVRHDPKDLELRFYGITALAESAAYPTDEYDALLAPLPAGFFYMLGDLHLVYGEVLERRGDFVGAERSFAAAKQAGVSKHHEERLALAFAAAKARTGDVKAVLDLVPKAEGASDHALLRRTEVLIRHVSDGKRIAAEETTVAARARQTPTVLDAYYRALMANGQPDVIVGYIARRFKESPKLFPPSDHFWREARRATNAPEAWPPSALP